MYDRKFDRIIRRRSVIHVISSPAPQILELSAKASEASAGDGKTQDERARNWPLQSYAHTYSYPIHPRKNYFST